MDYEEEEIKEEIEKKILKAVDKWIEDVKSKFAERYLAELLKATKKEIENVEKRTEDVEARLSSLEKEIEELKKRKLTKFL